MSSIYQIAKVCRKSAENNYPVLTGKHDGEILVPTYNWANHFQGVFRRLTGLKQYQYFSFSSQKPGIVTCRASLTSEAVEFNLLSPRGQIVPDCLPAELIPPSGLFLERQQYLYTEIREFCEEGTEDLVAPNPN